MKIINEILYHIIANHDEILNEKESITLISQLPLNKKEKLSNTLIRYSALQEITARDLLNSADTDRMKRAKKQFGKYGTHYSKVLDKGTIVFTTKSAGYDNPKYAGYKKTYTQFILPTEIEDVKKMKDLKDSEKVNLLLAGDLKVKCTCPDFLYFGNKYILTQLDAVLGDKEYRFPKIRNPKLKGSGLCKHLILVLQAVPFWIQDIAKDYKKKGVLE